MGCHLEDFSVREVLTSPTEKLKPRPRLGLFVAPGLIFNAYNFLWLPHVPIPKGLIICKRSPAAESWRHGRPSRSTPCENHVWRNARCRPDRHPSLLRGLQVRPLNHDVADRGSDDVRLSDIEPRFVCRACGKRGADHHGRQCEDFLHPATMPARTGQSSRLSLGLEVPESRPASENESGRPA